MAIPTQFPSLALAVRSAALQALVLRAGQVMEGKVLGTSANGITQVQIGKQVLNLTLPVLMQAGAMLNLQAQGSGVQQKLVLLPSPPQTPGSSTTPTQAAIPTSSASSPLPAPASIVTVSQQGVPHQQAANPTPQPGASVAQQQPANQAQQAPAPIPMSTRPGALQPLALQSGQQVEARVLGPAPGGATQIQIGQRTLEVILPTPLAPGAVLTVQVEGEGAQQRLVLAPVPAPTPIPASSPQSSGNPAPVPQAPVNAGGTQQPLPAPGTMPDAAPLQSGSNVAQASAPAPSQPATPQPAPPLPQQPISPQAALSQMVQAAVQRQDSVGNLATVLAAAVSRVALPQPVLQAAQQVLATSLPLTPAVDGATIQRAIANSGIFQEAALAQGAPQLAKGDLKTTLLVLRGTLVNWLGQQAGSTAVPPGPLPPPVRGAVPRARSANTGPIDIPETPIEAGKVMLSRTEGALARVRLHQHASLPETAMPGAAADWSTDIPVFIGNYQTVMQLQIHREAAPPEQPVSERAWQIHFAMDLPGMGEVGAQVGLRGGVTSVRLWATNPETAANLEQAAPELSMALAAAGLRPGMIMVRAEEPVQPPVSNGHFVDTLK